MADILWIIGTIIVIGALFWWAFKGGDGGGSCDCQ